VRWGVGDWRGRERERGGGGGGVVRCIYNMCMSQHMCIYILAFAYVLLLVYSIYLCVCVLSSASGFGLLPRAAPAPDARRR